MMVPLFALSVGALFAGLAFRTISSAHGAAEFWRRALFTGADNHILARL